MSDRVVLGYSIEKRMYSVTMAKGLRCSSCHVEGGGWHNVTNGVSSDECELGTLVLTAIGDFKLGREELFSVDAARVAASTDDFATVPTGSPTFYPTSARTGLLAFPVSPPAES